jgi:hypothetical protein
VAADFISKVVQRLVPATAVGGHVEFRRVGDVDAGDFSGKGGCGHGSWKKRETVRRGTFLISGAVYAVR